MSAGVRWYFLGLIGRIIGGRDGVGAVVAAVSEASLVMPLLLSEEEEEEESTPDGCGVDDDDAVRVV